MTSERPRIPPLEPPYLPEAAAELGRWMGRGAALEPLKLFRTLVRHLPLAEAMLPLGRYLLSRRLSVDLHEREVVIERVCARCGSEYEWGVHASVFGQAAGLSDAQVRATAMGGSHDPAWSERERLLVRLVDELHDTAHVSEDLWSHLASEWSPEQLLDLFVLAGWYHVICYVTNGALVQHEDWQARFPASEASASETSVPVRQEPVDLTVQLAALLAALPHADRPRLLALLERRAAERYRRWATECGDEQDAKGLLACAEREAEIATLVERLFPGDEKTEQRISSLLPRIDELVRSIFGERSLLEQLTIQAAAERRGAEVWVGLATAEGDAARQGVLHHCARLETESAEFLEDAVQRRASMVAGADGDARTRGEATGVEGGCFCGYVRYRATAAPRNLTTCHCTDCRSVAGAPVVTWGTFDAQRLAFTRGGPRYFKSSASVVRGFCAACGTCLTYQREDLPEEIDVTVCSFDDPARFLPHDHTWFSEHLPWVCVEDGLPRFERSRSGR